ncbi:MAG: fructosamine kinase family protein [Anaerolineales bacterium]|nr:fructosamine kinase family protein [Anaerolineales bacterium]
MIPNTIETWCQSEGYGDILSFKHVGGGCINNGVRLITSSGKSLFLKTNQHNPLDMFAREAEGLQALSIDNGPRVPEVLLFGEHFLLLEDLSPANRRNDFWEVFGFQMAVLHNQTNDHFGFYHDNYIGSTPQPNPWTSDGFLFFMEYRLKYQAQLALKRGLLNKEEVGRVESLGRKLPEIIPIQPASLIHGDLWSGNVTSDSKGMPAIIDPAAHFGWAEADLAMTDLFGSFPDVFYHSYQEIRKLENGFRDRFQIYNLYHLINHLNLFGTTYRGQVMTVLDTFVK